MVGAVAPFRTAPVIFTRVTALWKRVISSAKEKKQKEWAND